MATLPRLAVGTIQREVDSQPLIWALLAALEQEGLRIQSFLSRSCFAPHDAAAVVTGHAARHLDSWLMAPEDCRALFYRKGSSADLAVVEGVYDCATTSSGGGSLDTLCSWLKLPRLAILDVSRLKSCCLPPRPAVDGLLLDRVAGECELFRWQTVLESLWGIPVLGALDASPVALQAIVQLPPGHKPPRELCQELGTQYRRLSTVQRVLDLANRNALDDSLWSLGQPSCLCSANVRVAVAYDDAFHCYFPDTLDMLELQGATIRVFSPLKDECLPTQSDIVYLGCGHPHQYATALAENHCMLMALKEHICAGRRVYGEGGGLAYLCQHIESDGGQLVPMVGAIRAVARRNPQRSAPQPVEFTTAEDNWLGPAGTRIRGYRNQNWLLTPSGCLTQFSAVPEYALDLVGRHQVIGSRLHLNFATQPALLGGFMRPCPQALAWSAAP